MYRLIRWCLAVLFRRAKPAPRPTPKPPPVRDRLCRRCNWYTVAGGEHECPKGER